MSAMLKKTNLQPGKHEVCEEFLGFCSVPNVNAETITSAFVSLATNAGLNTVKLVGKGFDGAATMSGHVSGISTQLKELYPNAKNFSHCCNHALNIVLVAEMFLMFVTSWNNSKSSHCSLSTQQSVSISS